ncbi:hypothetical protein MUP77_01855 [Candidatus Bathyarchaeota archaeon]|nr:hypothetical protein [Candidatus Bathyarchaeota archaeon]
MGRENKVNAHRFGRRKIALIALILIIFTSIEVYAHIYVWIHGLPVVSEEEVQTRFSNLQYYTGHSVFSSSGCRWLVGWLVRRPVPQNGYVFIFKTQQNGSYFVLNTDFVVLGLKATSNNTSSFTAHIDEIDYESNCTAIRIDYELGEIGTYQIDFELYLRVYERTLLGLIPKEDVMIPINATVYYGP